MIAHARIFFYVTLVVLSALTLASCRSSRSSRTNTARNRPAPAPAAEVQASGPSAKSVLTHADSALAHVRQLSNEDKETPPMAEPPMPRGYTAPMPPPMPMPYIARPDLTAYGLYEEALGAYNGRRYDEAIALFSQVVTTGRPPELVPNAYYWMGEAFYAQGRYAESVPYFEYVTHVGPQYKREMSLFKLSRGGLHLGNRQQANMYYERLRNEYPRRRYISTLRKLGTR